jgi:hypothetical protein
MTDIKISEQATPNTNRTILPTLRLPRLIHYSRHFHKNRSTPKFNAHFKVLHSIKPSPRELSLSSTVDIIGKAKAYAYKLSIPLGERNNADARHDSRTLKLKKLKMRIDGPTSVQLIGKRKEKYEEKYWSPKYESDILPAI